MVTKNQIAQLSARIDALADQLGLAEKPTYRVWLSFTGESDEEFYVRHPDARGCRHQGIVLSFGNDASSAPVPRNERTQRNSE